MAASRQLLTYLHARLPRVKCPDHGVRQVRLPWAEPMSRFTTLFERMALDVLKECDVLGSQPVVTHQLVREVASDGAGRRQGPGAQRAGRPPPGGRRREGGGTGAMTASPW